MPAPVDEEATEEEKKMEEERKKMPRADAMLLIDDFEYWAERVLSGTAWNYYKSAADREISELIYLSLCPIYLLRLSLLISWTMLPSQKADRQPPVKTWTHSNDIISDPES
jgi:hypothetical protein